MSRVASRHLDSEAPAGWLRYASAAGVALASTGASADIILVPGQGQVGMGSSVWVDLNGDAVDDVSFWMSSQSLATNGIDYRVQYAGLYALTVGAVNLFGPLPIGALVDGASAPQATIWNSGWGYADEAPSVSFGLYSNYGLSVGGSQYFGVRLSGGQFGWIHVQLTVGDLNEYTSLSMLNGAYDNTGAAIHVGTVPEPSSFAGLGLLAAGAGGVFALKRFRKQQLIEEAKA